jgi:hypothetical protein
VMQSPLIRIEQASPYPSPLDQTRLENAPSVRVRSAAIVSGQHRFNRFPGWAPKHPKHGTRFRATS